MRARSEVRRLFVRIWNLASDSPVGLSSFKSLPPCHTRCGLLRFIPTRKESHCIFGCELPLETQPLWVIRTPRLASRTCVELLAFLSRAGNAGATGCNLTPRRTESHRRQFYFVQYSQYSCITFSAHKCAPHSRPNSHGTLKRIH